MSMRFGNLALMLAVFCVLMACESSGTTTQHQTDGDVIADNDKEAATDGDTDNGSEEENTDLGETEDISEAEESAPDGDAPTENEVEPETPVDGDEDSTESADDTDVTGDNPESETTDDAENPDGDQAETDGPPPCPAWDGKPDLPDPEYIDNDCDGIDGSKENAIFVDPVNGSNMYSGSFGFPVEDMEKALELAQKEGAPKAIYAAVGDYEGAIYLADGISLYGGFLPDQGWARGEEYSHLLVTTPEESGNLRAVSAQNCVRPAELAFFSLRVGSLSLTNGGSTYGVWVVDCPDFAVHHVEIVVGDGAKGTSGAPGQAGKAGTKGNGGDDAHDDSTFGDDRTKGGAGLDPNCDDDMATASGFGGRGGTGGPDDDPHGEDGTSVFGGGAQGKGAVEGDGGKAQPGEPGLPGGEGRGGDAKGGVDQIGYWRALPGTTGGKGTHGTGGGGGGGGGGTDGGFWLGSVWGGGGGGGGTAGCLGTGGIGGQGGGGAFGVYYLRSTPKVHDSEIIVGNGGPGGDGGEGGAGGKGGEGGKGGNSRTVDDIFGGVFTAGAGGLGGAGGDGGRGGHGGGGAGGVSYGICSLDEAQGITEQISNNRILPGLGGTGGKSMAAGAQYQGANGDAGDIYRTTAVIVP